MHAHFKIDLGSLAPFISRWDITTTHHYIRHLLAQSFHPPQAVVGLRSRVWRQKPSLGMGSSHLRMGRSYAQLRTATVYRIASTYNARHSVPPSASRRLNLTYGTVTVSSSAPHPAKIDTAHGKRARFALTCSYHAALALRLAPS